MRRLPAALLLAGALAVGLGTPARAETTLWIPATSAPALSPWMIRAADVQLADAEAWGDFLTPIVTAGQSPHKPVAAADFAVDVPRAGNYFVWARVRCPSGLPEGFAVAHDTAPAIPLSQAADEAADVRGWHWVGLPGGHPGIALPAGRSTLRVLARDARATVFGPLSWKQAEPTFNPRLNVVGVSSEATFVPTDARVRPSVPAAAARVAAARVTTAQLPPVAAETWKAADKKPLPDWMRVPRWYTKDSWRSELTGRQPGDIAQLVRQVAANGGNALRLSVDWGGEVYYQSRVAPHAPGLGRLDYLREAVDEGRRTGVKIVVYINPNTLYLGHPLFPECAVRDRDGQPVTAKTYGGNIENAPRVCINHPRYRQFLRDLMTEIFGHYQADGLYVDGLTPHLCFCQHCRAKYHALCGAEMPVAKLATIARPWTVWGEFGRDPQPVGDVENDVDARRLTEMVYQSFGEITREVSLAVKAARPEAITTFHSHPKANCAEFYDGTLTEVYSPRPWVHIAWRSGELAGYSSGFHVPTMFNVYPHQHYTAAEARYHAWQGLANGAYPNFWSTPGMQPVFEFLRENAAWFDFARTAPVKFIALPRDLRTDAVQSGAAPPPGIRYTTDRFLAPYVGAYSALTRAGLPVVTLHRPHFEEGLAGFQVLCLANVAVLSDAQVAAVRQFVHDGGGLIATHETSLRDEKGRPRSDFGLADVLGVRFQKFLPAAKRRISFAPDAPLAAALAKLPPLETGVEPHVSVAPTTGQIAAEAARADDTADTTPAAIVNQFGRGRSIYLPGRLDAQQCYELAPGVERLFAEAARWVSGDRVPVEVQAPAMVGVSLTQLPDRWLVQLVNHHVDSRYQSDTISPIQGVTVRLRPPAGREVASLRRLHDRSDVPLRRAGAHLIVDLPQLNEYEALAITFATQENRP